MFLIVCLMITQIIDAYNWSFEAWIFSEKYITALPLGLIIKGFCESSSQKVNLLRNSCKILWWIMTTAVTNNTKVKQEAFLLSAFTCIFQGSVAYVS